jgi:hypothetical protein
VTTHRQYTFTTGLQEGHEAAARVLTAACDAKWWFNDSTVSDSGDLVFGFEVCARDQWWAHRRATMLAVDVIYAAGGSEDDVPVPDWQKLPPHTNRGFLRVVG